MPVTPFQNKTPKEKLLALLQWALTAFMLASGIVFLLSVPSIPMLAFACVCVPIERVQAFWRRAGVRGAGKWIVLVLLFALSVNFYARFGV